MKPKRDLAMANLQSVIGGTSKVGLHVLVHEDRLPRSFSEGDVVITLDAIGDELKAKYGFKYVRVSTDYDMVGDVIGVTMTAPFSAFGLPHEPYSNLMIQDEKLSGAIMADVARCCQKQSK